MSSPKSGGLSSIFAGVSIADLVRAASFARSRPTQNWPSPLEVAYAGRFAAQSQPSATHGDDAESDVLETVRARLAA
jgi:hypothetical protein